MKHKILYALVVKMNPGQTYSWVNPKSGIEFEWTANESGEVLFYVGETTMTLKERESKHRTFAKKLVKKHAGEEVNDAHDYPVYHFTKEFCGLNGHGFEAQLLQSGPGLSEAEWIQHAIDDGHPIQNVANGSKHLVKGFRPEDTSINGVFKQMNDLHFPKLEKKEPTPEEVAAAREAWVAARKT